jgi:hypothetical protein
MKTNVLITLFVLALVASCGTPAVAQETGPVQTSSPASAVVAVEATALPIAETATPVSTPERKPAETERIQITVEELLKKFGHYLNDVALLGLTQNGAPIVSFAGNQYEITSDTIKVNMFGELYYFGERQAKWDNKNFIVGNGRASIFEDPNVGGAELCFEYARPFDGNGRRFFQPVTDPVDAKTLEGSYISGRIERLCYERELIYLDDGHTVVVPTSDVVTPQGRNYEGRIEGYVHVEFEDVVFISEQPRNTTNDALVVSLIAKLYASPEDWGNKPDHKDMGPLEACADLLEYPNWRKAGISSSQVEYLCGEKMTFWDKYGMRTELASFFPDILVGITDLPLFNVRAERYVSLRSGGVFQLDFRTFVEVGEKIEGDRTLVYINRISEGKVTAIEGYLNPGDYLVIWRTDVKPGYPDNYYLNLGSLPEPWVITFR